MEENKTCPFCGNTVTSNMKFCTVCGYRLEIPQAPVNNPPAQPPVNNYNTQQPVEPGYPMPPAAVPEKKKNDKQIIIILVVILGILIVTAGVLLAIKLIGDAGTNKNRKATEKRIEESLEEEKEEILEEEKAAASESEAASPEEASGEEKTEEVSEVTEEPATATPADESKQVDESAPEEQPTAEKPAKESQAEESQAEAEEIVPVMPAELNAVAADSTVDLRANNLPASLAASTQIYDTSRGYDYRALYAMDSDLNTCWQENNPDTGIGEWLKLEYDGEITVNTIVMFAGYAKDESGYYANDRPSQMKLTFSDGQSVLVNCLDVFGYQVIQLPFPVKTTSIIMEIVSVYPGSQWKDLAISEILIQ